MKEGVLLQITTPCHENWESMTAREQGRYCQSCRKTVVDFSIMTDREVMDYISHNADGDTCGRVNNGQLNRLVQRPGERKASWKYFWSLALGSLLVSYRSVAQVKPPKSVVVNQKQIIMGGMSLRRLDNAPVYEFRGRVVNEAGAPVPYASIELGVSPGMAEADSAGQFKFSTTRIDKLEVMVSSTGYEPRALVAFEANKIKSLEVVNNKVTVQLNDFVLQGKPLDEIVVIGYHTMGKLDVMGSVVYIQKDTLATKLQQKIGDLARLVGINKPIDNIVNNSGNIKVYPNPAPVSGNFYVQLNVKEAGEYNVQFIDVSGRIIAGRQLTIAAPGQVEVFPGAALQGHGMYFVRVVGRKDGKLYTTKLMVE